MRVKNTFYRTAALFLMAAAALTSCAKNDDNGIEDGNIGPGGNGNTPDVVLLLTESKQDGNTQTRFEYNNQNQLTAVYFHTDGIHTMTVEYTYDSQGRPALMTNKLADGQSVTTEEHTYEGNSDKPVSTVVTNLGDNTQMNISYTYLDNQMIETMTLPPPVSESVNVYTYADNGDIVSVETSAGGVWGGTTEYGDYDDKKSPSLAGNPYTWKAPSIHNFQSMKTTRSEGIVEDLVYRHTSVFTG